MGRRCAQKRKLNLIGFRVLRSGGLMPSNLFNLFDRFPSFHDFMSLNSMWSFEIIVLHKIHIIRLCPLPSCHELKHLRKSSPKWAPTRVLPGFYQPVWQCETCDEIDVRCVMSDVNALELELCSVLGALERYSLIASARRTKTSIDPTCRLQNCWCMDSNMFEEISENSGACMSAIPSKWWRLEEGTTRQDLMTNQTWHVL